jgi:hypothetical protein
MMKVFVLVSLAASANAFSPIASSPRAGSTTRLQESFGFKFALDTYENQPDFLKGEQEYKQFVNKYKENNMLNRQVSCKVPSTTVYLAYVIDLSYSAPV